MLPFLISFFIGSKVEYKGRVDFLKHNLFCYSFSNIVISNTASQFGESVAPNK